MSLRRDRLETVLAAGLAQKPAPTGGVFGVTQKEFEAQIETRIKKEVTKLSERIDGLLAAVSAADEGQKVFNEQMIDVMRDLNMQARKGEGAAKMAELDKRILIDEDIIDEMRDESREGAVKMAELDSRIRALEAKLAARAPTTTS